MLPFAAILLGLASAGFLALALLLVIGWDRSHQGGPYGDPRVISQNIAFRQRDIPIRPQSTVVLQYDSADLPLAGIAVCRTEGDCRLLPVNYSQVYELTSYESLESLDPSWLTAIQSSPLHNYSNLVIIAFSLVPILLFSGWLYLNRRQKSSAG